MLPVALLQANAVYASDDVDDQAESDPSPDAVRPPRTAVTDPPGTAVTDLAAGYSHRGGGHAIGWCVQKGSAPVTKVRGRSMSLRFGSAAMLQRSAMYE